VGDVPASRTVRKDGPTVQRGSVTPCWACWSFSQSFHRPQPHRTPHDWPDSTTDLTCKNRTRQTGPDGALTSSKQQFRVGVRRQPGFLSPRNRKAEGSNPSSGSQTSWPADTASSDRRRLCDCRVLSGSTSQDLGRPRRLRDWHPRVGVRRPVGVSGVRSAVR
jgi:hypothetical protein